MVDTVGNADGAVANEPAHADARIAGLDGMRGIAIGMVVLTHVFLQPHMAAWQSWIGDPLTQLLYLSRCGVDLFFVLSGFLIGGIILDRRNAAGFFRAFYARRTARIFPLYFLLVTIAFLPLGALRVHADQGQVPLFGYLTFTANLIMSTGRGFAPWLGPLWSICIEEQFYLLSPPLLRSLAARAIPWALCLTAIASAGLRIAIRLKLVALPLIEWLFTLSHVDGLALGVLAAWLMRAPGFVSWSRGHPAAFRYAFPVLLVASASFSQLPRAMAAGPGIFVIGLTTFAAILTVRLFPESWLNRSLQARPLVQLGRYSYFVYLFHMPTLTLFYILFGRAALGHASATLVCGLMMLLLCWVASVSWRRFEAPLIALGRRVPYKPAPARAQALPVG